MYKKIFKLQLHYLLLLLTTLNIRVPGILGFEVCDPKRNYAFMKALKFDFCVIKFFFIDNWILIEK